MVPDRGLLAADLESGDARRAAGGVQGQGNSFRRALSFPLRLAARRMCGRERSFHMTRGIAIILLLFSTATLCAQTFTFTPPLPDSDTAISVRVTGIWNNFCTPRDPRVTKNGTDLRIDLTTSTESCLQAWGEWSQDVGIGYLDPGISITSPSSSTAHSSAR
jgi:hypothetical protein